MIREDAYRILYETAKEQLLLHSKQIPIVQISVAVVERMERILLEEQEEGSSQKDSSLCSE